METSDLVQQACNTVADHGNRIRPRVGLILGSGLGTLADLIQQGLSIPYGEIPGFPVSKVSGHAGNLVFGYLGATPVVAMQGRAHLYEGWSAPAATFPIRCMHRLGIETLIVSNASGGINPRFESGQVVAIDQHLDWMYQTGIHRSETKDSAIEFGIPNRCRVLYDRELLQMAEERAIRLGFQLARGTYLATLGPNYETRAEYRMFARLGADMVGMSTVPEVILAGHLGLRVLAFSIVTNVASPDVPKITHHSQVLDWSRRAQWQLIPLIQSIVKEL